MTGKFALCLAHTLKWEGGYVNDPDDPGGETNMGISKRSHPTLDIPSLTYEQVFDIYYRLYWKPCRAQDIEPLNLAGKLFDLSVNMGINRATRLLQAACGAEQDGKLGPKTLRLVLAHPDLLPLYKEQAQKRYEYLASTSPRMRKFLKGWLRRLKDDVC